MTYSKEGVVHPPTKNKPLAAPNPRFNPVSISRALWKQKWLTLSVWMLIGLCGTAYVLRLPFVYRAETLILVDSQRIPERYVVTTVVSDLQERLSTLSQQILSASRLEKIIESDHLYTAERLKYAQEEVIAMMRKDITVTVERSGVNRLGAFRVSYEGGNPVVVAKVANRLASLYMEENLKVRENEAEQTNDFLGGELEESKAKLDELEAKLSQYKREHMGALPEQESSLTGRVTGLQIAMRSNEDALNRTQQQILMLQNSIETKPRAVVEMQEADDTSSVAEGTNASPAPAIKTSEQLRGALEKLRLRYTDSHPDIRRLQAEIATAEEGEKEAGIASARAGNVHRDRRSVRLPAHDLAAEAHTAALRSQLAQSLAEQNTLTTERSKLIRETASYQARIELLPVREQEMAGLTRDYETSKLNYARLLDKKLDAKMAGKMEKLKKSESFTVLDEAKPPQKPIRPKRQVLIGAAWFFGLLLGISLGFGRESHNDVLLGEWELPTDIPVLGRVHEIAGPIHFSKTADVKPGAAGPAERLLFAGLQGDRK